ncbi:TonB-dependent receptor [Solimonas sp. K1W22B-7]|uniref:TonB-dependent receptor n=1 Tax=Solimonas sp. K1W22B-7 TaxID=2303331 RepID=UPI0013C40B48|nr:TonB-dependent receptor [Solimonas sp. K1W22B-7]
MRAPKFVGSVALCLWSVMAFAQETMDDAFLDDLLKSPDSSQEAEGPPPESTARSQDTVTAPASAPASSPQDAAGELETLPVESADVPLPALTPSKRAPNQPRIEEIVVTAQKRAESIQDTPISMAAFDAEMLEQRGISGIDDLQGNVPGLNVLAFPTQASTLRLFIRGIGLNESQVTQDPAVGIYMDGVYIARSAGLALDVTDLERIEVLRGPQGTLYGRNTTGGAVNLISKKPDPDAFAMHFSGTLGDRDLGSFKGTINMPLSDDAAVKFGVMMKRQNGYVENTGPGGDFGDRQSLGFRFDARWLPEDWLKIDYGFDFTDISLYSQMIQAVLRPESDKGSANLIREFGELNTVYSPHRLDKLATGLPMEESGTRIQGHALILTVPMDDHELKYIGAYRSLLDHYYTDLGGGAGSTEFRLDSNRYDGPAARAAFGGPSPLVVPTIDQSQWSHELQLSGAAFDESLRYIIGAFYFTEEATDLSPYALQATAALLPAQADALYRLFPDLVNQVASLAGPRVVIFNQRESGAENSAFAAFGQGTWTPDWLDQKLHLTAGFRHSRDKREAWKSYRLDTYLEVNLNGLGLARLLQSAPPFDHVGGSRAYDNNSYTLIAAYDLSPEANIYAKYVTGYRSGGFNTRDPQLDGNSGPASDGTDYGFGFVDGFAPEDLAAAEIGIKSDLLDGRLRVNADLFNTDLKNMQTNFLIAGTLGDTKARNAGHARLRGFELELIAAVTDWLRLSAEYSYLDARVLEVIDANGNNVADQYPFPSAPKHSGVAAADITLQESAWGVLRGTVNYSYTGWTAGGGLPGREDLSYIPSFGIVNARLGLSDVQFRRGSANFALFVQNLLDEEYITTTIPTLPHADRAVFWGEPRMIGAEVTYTW